MSNATPKEQKKFLMLLGVIIIAAALLTLRLLTWKWEKGNTSFFALPISPSADLGRFWQQSKDAFNRQTDTLKNNQLTQNQNQEIINNLKTRIEEQASKK